MKTILTKKQIPRAQFVVTGIAIAALTLVVAGVVYWYGQSVRTEVNGIRCRGPHLPRNTPDMIELPVIVEGQDISPSALACSVERWKKHESGENFIKISYALAIPGAIAGLGLSTLLWLGRSERKK